MTHFCNVSRNGGAGEVGVMGQPRARVGPFNHWRAGFFVEGPGGALSSLKLTSRTEGRAHGP
jgi:hypothetical protein